MGALSLKLDILPLSTSLLSPVALFMPRTRRILFGKREEALGVVGRTFRELCGDRDRDIFFPDEPVGVDTVSMLLEDADEAFE